MCVVLPTLLLEALRRQYKAASTVARATLERVRHALFVSEVVSAGTFGVGVENPVLLSLTLSLRLSAYLKHASQGLEVLLSVLDLAGTY